MTRLHGPTTRPYTSTTPQNRFKEMAVHPGITTLASCLIIALLLGLYLSMSTIRRCIRRHRHHFVTNREDSNIDSSSAIMKVQEHEEKKKAEAIQIKIIDSSMNDRGSVEQVKEALPSYGNAVKSPSEENSNSATKLQHLASLITDSRSKSYLHRAFTRKTKVANQFHDENAITLKRSTSLIQISEDNIIRQWF